MPRPECKTKYIVLCLDNILDMKIVETGKCQEKRKNIEMIKF